MRSFALRLLLPLLVFLPITARLRANDLFIKIQSVSPDKRFAMRIACDGTPADEENIDSALIQSISLVSLPGKKVVAQPLPKQDIQTTFSEVTLLWSADSKWCAFYYAQPRIGYTSVFHLGDSGRFTLLVNPVDLRVPFPKNSRVRNEYISPEKWLKPGVLQLRQEGIFSGEGSSDAEIKFVARFDPAKRKFSVLSKE